MPAAAAARERVDETVSCGEALSSKGCRGLKSFHPKVLSVDCEGSCGEGRFWRPKLRGILLVHNTNSDIDYLLKRPVCRSKGHTIVSHTSV
jgi:hypothetical protein